MYVFDATEQLKAISLETGRVLWRRRLHAVLRAGRDRLRGGDGRRRDRLPARGREREPGISWPVLGTVADPNGTPLAGVQIYTGRHDEHDEPLRRVLLRAAERDLHLRLRLERVRRALAAPRRDRRPSRPFPVVLDPLALYPLVATVEDADSGHGVANVTVDVYGVDEFLAVRVSGPGGTLALGVPAVRSTLNAQSSGTHAAAATTFVMPAGPFGGVIVAVAPTDLAVPASDPYRCVPSRADRPPRGGRHRRSGSVAARSAPRDARPPAGLLSPFARYVAQRALLLPVQMVVLLTVLYIFGTFLPAAATNSPVCVASGAAGCGYCSWSDPVCVAQAFGSGYWTFIANLFTGAWGTARYGHLTEPAWTFLHWYLPDSLELAAVALTISAVSAYVLGLSAGWNRDGYVDTGVRGASALGVLLPSFLVALVIFTIVYDPFVRTYGDTPFGILPGPGWFEATGGNVPGWIGLAYNTSPTGFPIVDAVLHGAWQAALITATKTILQALLIAAIYVPLYLRFARHAVAQAAEEPSVVAARARGIPESTIRWHHTGRRVVPIFLLAFAATLPLYIGTQSLVEALANDPGVGSLLLSEMTGYRRPASGSTRRRGR